MNPIFFAFVSYFAWATGDIFGTVAARKLDAYSITFWNYVLRVIIFSLYIPFGLTQLYNLSLGLFFINILLALFLLVGFISFNESLRIGNAALAGTIAASFTALVVVLSLVFLNETISFLQIFSIVTIFIGIVLSTLDLRFLNKGKLTLDRGIVFALIAMVCWGIYFTFIKIPVRQIGWFWPNYISFMLFPLTFLFMKINKLKLKNPNFKGALPFLIGAVVLTGIAEFSFNFGISKGLTAIVAPIAGSYPTLFVILAFFVFKDKITKQQIAGIIITLFGIVLLSFMSV